MNDHAGMRRLLLEEGLEDLIALPEAADACRYEGFIRGDDDESLHPVMQSLLDLFRAGEIQVWAGHWNEDEELVEHADVEGLLSTPARYRWSSDLDLERRVY